MIRNQEPLSVFITIFIGVVGLAVFVLFSVVPRFQLIETQTTAATIPATDTSSWQTYTNQSYGFTLQYPQDWTLSTSGLLNTSPSVAIGNPLSGMKIYVLQIFIEQNPHNLDSGSYVHALLAEDKTIDIANVKAGPSPQTTPEFSRTEVLTLGGYPAYELYRVFEFDHDAEQIYVAHSGETLRFDFPVAEENPNLSLPVANNYIARQIANTLVFAR